ncbi:tetratricopeptide repeat protein [Candidatus Borkfalkia ceftriaxoniphila]|uniref:Tetratricopeptide repeat protein n=1 Tax=Candidatus Borkfalkia ceftriaxoniphila TaxID=2508949 RepID=A0A4Q2KEH9_9FIRM|nr:tetratricopeptide repeat protein [Candidatus Borkfalkia ceftriaxoniphila]RXZ62387.1 tetratricopeptide repeat protein [Candidatus Borkfalkia ceftriaxoniphila]
MDEKVIAFDAGEDRLVELAERYCDEKNFCAALRMIHKKINLYGAEPDDWMFLAEIYDDMETYEMAINCWFRYLAVCEIEALADAYEGLAACYYNVGNEAQSAYYYNKMLSEDDDVPAESKMEIARMFTRSPKSLFKVVYPPEKADYGETVDEGVKLLKSGKYEDAATAFSKVHPASRLAGAAKNYLAVCHLVTGDSDAAEKDCLELLEKDPDDVQALSTYCAVLIEKKQTAKSREIARRLASISTENPDELYKIATVCCESGLDAEAYEKFCVLEEIVRYDLTLIYFKSVAACKCGKYRESLEGFGKIIDVFPHAEVARYYYNAMRLYLEEGGQPPAVDYFYKLPKAERDKRVQLLAALSDVKSDELRRYGREYDLVPLFRWCFDEFDGQEPELQLLAVNVAVRAGEYGFLQEMFLDSTVNDVIKIETARKIFERNKDASIAVVLCDVFKQLEFVRLEVGRVKHKIFVSAYSMCAAKFCLLGNEHTHKFNRAAVKMYNILEEKNLLTLVTDKESLACAIFLFTRKGKGDFKGALESFRADETNVRTLLEAVRQGDKNETH